MNKNQKVTVWDVKLLDRTLWAKAQASENHEWALLAAHEAGRMSMLIQVMLHGDSQKLRVHHFGCSRDFITDMEEAS